MHHENTTEKGELTDVGQHHEHGEETSKIKLLIGPTPGSCVCTSCNAFTEIHT